MCFACFRFISSKLQLEVVDCNDRIKALQMIYFTVQILRSNQPKVFFSQNKPAPVISHQQNEQTAGWYTSIQANIQRNQITLTQLQSFLTSPKYMIYFF
jgi:hypothetical protein